MVTIMLRVKKLTPSVGAEVLEVDRGRLLSDETLPRAVMDALEANGALLFPGLHIDDETQVAFCRKLGEVVSFPDQQIPEVFVITLDPAKNPRAEHLHANVYWHIDGTSDPIPAKASVMSAKVVAADGGDTEFASTYAAYDDLSDDDKERYGSLRVRHSLETIQRLVFPNPTPEQVAYWSTRSREHPLVWRHHTGRCSLVIGQNADHVVGMDLDEGRTLLKDLLNRATTPDRVLRHRWREGDMVIWDNRGVLHRATPYDPASGREMHRTTLVGDEPIQ
jgi:alpha-ketoglutarate-dependent taurine dioxygenase